jgi:hypothetical protein
MRFILAYDAARTLSLMIVRAAGYRPKTVGGYYNTFLALEAADPAFARYRPISTAVALSATRRNTNSLAV